MLDNALILEAFLRVRDGRSPDVVIADPALNVKFIEACRTLGATAEPHELNHRLYNLRKLRELGPHPTTRRSRLKDQDEYRFAVEIAVRFLEQREGTTLDRIICHPMLAAEFDKLAEEIAPGRTSFEYRCTALSLRKKSGLKPEMVARILAETQVSLHPVSGLNLEQISREQGVYVFFYRRHGVLYVGEAMNLRNRIRKHLDHSDRKELARWLWEFGSDDLFVELHVLPAKTSTLARRALERELIRSRRPRFNISGTESKGT